MEIDQHNYAAALPVLEKKLNECDYFSIDLEFSGIDRDNEPVKECTDEVMELRAEKFLKPLDQYYEKKRDGIKDFTIMQLGLTTFTTRPRQTQYEEAQRELTEMLDKGRRASISSEVLMVAAAAFESVFETEKELNASDVMSRLRKSVEFLSQFLVDVSKDIGASYTLRDLEFLGSVHRLLANLALSGPCIMDSTLGDVYDTCTVYFYLFPAPNACAETSAISADTFQFLFKNHLDFNKWVGSGLPFTSARMYAAAQTGAVMKKAAYLDELLHPSAAKGFPESEARGIADLGALSRGEMNYLNFIREAGAEFPSLFTSAVKVVLAARSGQSMKLGSQVGLGSSTFISNKETNKKEFVALQGIGLRKIRTGFEVISPTSIPTNTKPIKEEYAGNRLLELIFHATGKLKKPVVFFSGFTDILFLVKTVDGALPEDYMDFKCRVHALFPQLYDVRSMCFDSSVRGLANLTDRLERTFMKLKSVMPADLRSRFVSETLVDAELSDVVQNSAAHNAGYDAYLTGCVFAYLKTFLRKSGVDTTAYKNVVPHYNSILSTCFGEEEDRVVQEDSQIVYVYPTTATKALSAEILRNAFDKQGLDVSVQYEGFGYIVHMPNAELFDSEQSLTQSVEDAISSMDFTCRVIEIY